PNLADPNSVGVAKAPASAPNPANATITFELTNVINMNVVGGSTSGNFTPDDQMPGVPASDSTTDGLAADVVTYLDLPAGLVTMGVTSDNGFRTTVGKPPQDALKALNVGQGSGTTTFYINVQQAGVYAFRTVWENGTGGAYLEWFTVKPNGTQVLVNDVANG